MVSQHKCYKPLRNRAFEKKKRFDEENLNRNGFHFRHSSPVPFRSWMRIGDLVSSSSRQIPPYNWVLEGSSCLAWELLTSVFECLGLLHIATRRWRGLADWQRPWTSTGREETHCQTWTDLWSKSNREELRKPLTWTRPAWRPSLVTAVDRIRGARFLRRCERGRVGAAHKGKQWSL